MSDMPTAALISSGAHYVNEVAWIILAIIVHRRFRKGYTLLYLLSLIIQPVSQFAPMLLLWVNLPVTFAFMPYATMGSWIILSLAKCAAICWCLYDLHDYFESHKHEPA